MKALVFAIFVGLGVSCGQSVQAHSRVIWLLVGLDQVPASYSVYPRYSGETPEAQLERLFRRALIHTGYELRVKFKATQGDLFKAVTDSRTLALFWMSHGVGYHSKALNPAGLLVDAEGFDVGSILRSLHPNVRYLSLIGCESRVLANDFQDLARSRPLLKIGSFAPHAFVEPVLGLTTQLRAGLLHLSHVLDYLDPIAASSSDLIALRIRRVADRTGAALLPIRIEVSNRVVATLPSAIEGEWQMTIAQVPRADLHQARGIIAVATSPTRDKVTASLGAIEIETCNHEFSWTTQRDQNGKELGKFRRVYRPNFFNPIDALSGSEGSC